MGPCQGRLCHRNSIRVYAEPTGTDEAAIGTTTARPPWAPVRLGLLAGRPHEPRKRTSIHHRHEELGATIMWTGAWRRPHSYGDPDAEVRAVHEALGVIDVSTLGKILVEGPDAAAFLERLYPNRFADLKVGRIRYGVLATDAGRIMDDGTVARLADDEFYVTTTSTGADGVSQWFEWWNAVWRLDVEFVNLTGALAAINVAGPRARELMARVSPLDVSAEAFAYLDAKHAHVAGVPCLRCGSASSASSATSCTSRARTPSTCGTPSSSRAPTRRPAVRARAAARSSASRRGTSSSARTPTPSRTSLAAGMPWIVKLDKDDFVGKWALEHVARARLPRAARRLRDARTAPSPSRAARSSSTGRPAGRVTSARRSETVGKAIGLAWVPPELATEGATLRSA